MTESKNTYSCPEIPQIEDLFKKGAERASTVRKLLDDLEAAKHAEVEVAKAFAETLADSEGTLVEEAREHRLKLEARVEALRTAHDLLAITPSLEIAAMAEAEVTQSQEMREVFAVAFEAKAEAAQKLLAPASEGILPRIRSLLNGGKVTPEKATKKAEEFSAEGKYLKAVEPLGQSLRQEANRIRNGGVKPSNYLLEYLKSPLPQLSDFADNPSEMEPKKNNKE